MTMSGGFCPDIDAMVRIHVNTFNEAPRGCRPVAARYTALMHGTEWIIDAAGCDPAALRDPLRLRTLFDRFVADLSLTPVAAPVWHAFPAPGGITGFVVLAESHLACHTFPEFGAICVNVFCCRPRAEVDAAQLLTDVLGATRTRVRRLERAYAPPAAVGA
jgi:S-adenosylmethionine decarboxylase